MPQFETTYFFSQIFWLFISFGGLCLGIKFLIFPLFNSIFSARQAQIDTLLRQAEVLTQKVQKLEEKQEIQKQHHNKQFSNQLAMTQEESLNHFQTEIEKAEKSLLKSLQTKVHKMEGEEKEVLKCADDFISKVKKGTI